MNTINWDYSDKPEDMLAVIEGQILILPSRFYEENLYPL